MKRLHRLLLIPLTVCLVGTFGLADDDPAELHILKARFDFGPRPGTDRIILKAAFDPAELIAGKTPENSELAVTIGTETVLSLPPLDERMRLRSKKERVWRLRVKPTREHRDSLKLRLDVVKGKLKLTGERLDLRNVRGTGAEEVTFTLTLAGATFSKTIELGVKESRWRYRYTGPAFVPSEPGGGIPPIDPGPPADEVTFRTLPIRSNSRTYGERTVVLRTPEEFAAEWAKYDTPLQGGVADPLPTVDFTKEIVLLIDFGLAPTGDYWAEVKSVTEVGTGLAVEWWGWSTGGCPVLGIPEASCFFIAVTRRDGPVTFTKESHTQQCF